MSNTKNLFHIINREFNKNAWAKYKDFNIIIHS